jgi:hypothetical protein
MKSADSLCSLYLDIIHDALSAAGKAGCQGVHEQVVRKCDSSNFMSIRKLVCLVISTSPRGEIPATSQIQRDSSGDLGMTDRLAGSLWIRSQEADLYPVNVGCKRGRLPNDDLHFTGFNSRIRMRSRRLISAVRAPRLWWGTSRVMR